MQSILHKADSRGHSKTTWLDSYHTFSFADYNNPHRVHFGALRVLNDDVVAPAYGFDTHPHQNMEIITIPLKGELRHTDSLRHGDVIGPGTIQVMSAGTGVFHSEYNNSDVDPVELLQIWVFPREKNTAPKYVNHNIKPLLKKNRLNLIISPDGKTAASILQDAWFSMGNIHAETNVNYRFHQKGNGLYIFVIEGEVHVEEFILSKRDALGLYECDSIKMKVTQNAQVLLMEFPM